DGGGRGGGGGVCGGGGGGGGRAVPARRWSDLAGGEHAGSSCVLKALGVGADELGALVAAIHGEVIVVGVEVLAAFDAGQDPKESPCASPLHRDIVVVLVGDLAPFPAVDHRSSDLLGALHVDTVLFQDGRLAQLARGLDVR